MRRAGRKEMQNREGGEVKMKAGNTPQTGCVLCVRSTRPRKQHTFAHMRRNTSTLLSTVKENITIRQKELVWFESGSPPTLAAERDLCSVTSKLTCLLKRADNTRPVARFQAEERIDAVTLSFQSGDGCVEQFKKG